MEMFQGYNVEDEDSSPILFTLFRLKMGWLMGSRPMGTLVFYFSAILLATGNK